MQSKPPVKLNRLEHQAAELEERMEAATAHWEKIERDKKTIEREEIERGVLRHHRDELAAAPEIDPFLDSISKIEAELARRQEELKKLYQEEWPKERQERDSRRYEMEGLQARFRVINERVLSLRLKLAAEALRNKKGDRLDPAEEQKRRWNEAIIAKEMSKLEREMKAHPATPQDMAKLKELKADQARNDDLSQPPPIITPSTNL